MMTLCLVINKKHEFSLNSSLIAWYLSIGLEFVPKRQISWRDFGRILRVVGVTFETPLFGGSLVTQSALKECHLKINPSPKCNSLRKENYSKTLRDTKD